MSAQIEYRSFIYSNDSSASPLSTSDQFPVLFMIFMDNILRCSQVAEGVEFGGLRITFLADDAVLLNSVAKLPQAVCSLLVPKSLKGGVEEFKYFRVMRHGD